MQLRYSKRISIENNPHIYFWEDYLNFIVENEITDLKLHDKIIPKLYFFDETRHITLVEWFGDGSKDWNTIFQCFKLFFFTHPNKALIFGYALVWSYKENMNIVMSYRDDYEEIYRNEAFMYCLNKIADYYLGSSLQKSYIREDFFKLLPRKQNELYYFSI